MLTLAATPIGNLDDASKRLAETLQSADLIYAEDTRHSRKLLQHLGIEKPLQSWHEHSSQAALNRIGKHLQEGRHLVYISDAGTPAISDPGFQLVRLAHQLGVPVDAVPGPCAAINALVLSGLPTHEFCFLGFFPTKTESRARLLQRLRALAMTAIFYESPKRVRSTLEFLAKKLTNTPIAVCRELTKRHQQTLRGTASQILEQLTTEKGEFVLLIGPVEEPETRLPMEQRYQQLTANGLSPTQAAKQIAAEYGIPKRQVYQKFCV